MFVQTPSNSYCTILSSTSYYPWYCRFYCCPTTTWVSMTWIYSPMIMTNVWINKGRFVDDHLFLSAKDYKLGSPSCSVEGSGTLVEGGTLFRHSITIPPKPYISPRQDQVDGWVRLDLASFVSIWSRSLLFRWERLRKILSKHLRMRFELATLNIKLILRLPPDEWLNIQFAFITRSGKGRRIKHKIVSSRPLRMRH